MATSNITKNLTTYDMPALITCIICLWAVSAKFSFSIITYNHCELPWSVESALSLKKFQQIVLTECCLHAMLLVLSSLAGSDFNDCSQEVFLLVLIRHSSLPWLFLISVSMIYLQAVFLLVLRRHSFLPCLVLISVSMICSQAVFLLVLSRHSPLPWMVLIHVTSTMYLLHHLTRSQSVWHFLSPGYFTSVSALLVVVLTTAFRNRESFRGVCTLYTLLSTLKMFSPHFKFTRTQLC